MHHKVIKICFVFSLMMTFQISSAIAIKTHEELLESVGLQSSKVVLRVLYGLRNNQKPDLSTELPPSTPHRIEKAQHVLDILSLFFNKKIIKINITRMQKLKEFQKKFQGEELLISQRFLQEWQIKKEEKYGQRTPSLEHNFKQSIETEIMSDFIVFEEPDPQTFEEPDPQSSLIASTSTLPPHVDPDMFNIISGFVRIDKVFSFTEVDLIKSEVISTAEAARLSPLVLHKPLLEAGSSTDILPPFVAVSTEHNDLLEGLALDKKCAKIILESILEGYRIPSKEFAHMSKMEQEDRYGKVVAYLMWVLHNKKEKVLRQKAALVPDNPRYGFDCDWYDSKLAKYERRCEAMTSPDIPSGKSFFANIRSRFTSLVPQPQIN
ncbi:MAG: hypothetical protein JNJ47_02490 [Alphaproteobacteria bacterium]|nr:hypothetical protein [Alphaproteobacteria bacterium]